MDASPKTDEKRMRLRYAGVCRICGSSIPARVEAVYERSSKTIRCLAHLENLAPTEQTSEKGIDPGIPGASARREFERRKSARVERIRSKHPRLGGMILALTEDPQSTTAWDTGAIGEERLGQRLNELANDELRVLHDRRIPKSRANVDHITVGKNGVHVIDAKRYKGRPKLRIEGGLLRPQVEKLVVGSRDCTKLVDGVMKQVGIVQAIVGDQAPVTGTLCFVEADWPLLGGDFSIRAVDVMWPKKLYPRLTSDGPLNADSVRDIHEQLARALPPA